MTAFLRACAPRLIVLLACAAAGASAMAQGGAPSALSAPSAPPTAPSAPSYLPFVDGSGIVSQNLRRAAVVRALGTPQVDEKHPALRYPELGLSFVLPIADASKDAPVLWMIVHAPSSAQTFGGLRVGLPQAMALEILERDYKLASRPAKPENWVRVTDREQSTKRELEVRFEGGQVSQLTFTTHAPGQARDPTRRTLFELPPHLAIVAVVAGLSALVAAFLADRAGARRRWRMPGRIAGPLGAALLFIGIVAFWVSLGGMREGDPYGRMANLLGIVFGIGAGFFGIGIMAMSDSRLFAWPAKGALALVIIATLLNQTGWLPR